MVAMNERNDTYRPDVIIPPGEHIQEMIDERGWTQVELARRTGRPVQTINEIIKGKRAITAETALQLEEVLGVSAQTWMNLESSYRLALLRKDRPQFDVCEAILTRFAIDVADAEDRLLGFGEFISMVKNYGPPGQVIADICAMIEDRSASEIARVMKIDEEKIKLFKRVTEQFDVAV